MSTINLQNGPWNFGWGMKPIEVFKHTHSVQNPFAWNYEFMSYCAPSQSFLNWKAQKDAEQLNQTGQLLSSVYGVWGTVAVVGASLLQSPPDTKFKNWIESHINHDIVKPGIIWLTKRLRKKPMEVVQMFTALGVNMQNLNCDEYHKFLYTLKKIRDSRLEKFKSEETTENLAMFAVAGLALKMIL